MRKLTYFVAASSDGYIAGPQGETDRFEQGHALVEYLAEHFPETLPTPARRHLGVDGPPKRFDAVVMGRGTYAVGADQGLTNPYGHLDQQVVMSRTLDPDVDPAVEVRAGDPVSVIKELKSADGMGVWLCGGGVLAGALIDEIDELVVKRQSMVLGMGRSMFFGAYRPTSFRLYDRQEVGTVAIESYRR